MDLPTPDVIKGEYLFGIPLTDENGNVYPDPSIQRWIDKAVDWLQHELQIKIAPTPIVETHDYYIQEYVQFCYVQLHQFPVVSVQGLKASYAGQDIMTFPPDWIKVYKESGQLQLVPTTGSLAQVLLGQGSGVLLPLITNRLSSMPHLFEVSYTAGFAAGGVPGNIHDLIAMKASIGILNVLGDILLGAGIASQSISIDGLSQSVNTTQSAENSAYSARIKQYLSEIKHQMPDLKKFYKGIRFVVA